MAKRGGARPGAGRPKGSVNRRSVDTLAHAMASGQSPVEYMLAIMRDDDADPNERAWAAEKAAPYLHPRPAPEQRRIVLDLPDTTSIDGVKEAARAVIRATAAGDIAPSEAQSLIAVLEVQRKAIETEDVLERLERLEAKVGAK